MMAARKPPLSRYVVRPRPRFGNFGLYRRSDGKLMLIGSRERMERIAAQYERNDPHAGEEDV